MSLDQFRQAVINSDVARANRYTVSIEGVLTRETELLCTEVNLPSETIQSFEYATPGIGPVTKIPNRVLFEALSMSFMNLGSNQPYSSFRDWQNQIYDDNYRFNDMNSYTKDIIIREKNRQDQTIGIHQFLECYPQVVGPKSKNYAPSNAPEIFPVVINYETSQYFAI